MLNISFDIMGLLRLVNIKTNETLTVYNTVAMFPLWIFTPASSMPTNRINLNYHIIDRCLYTKY